MRSTKVCTVLLSRMQNLLLGPCSGLSFLSSHCWKSGCCLELQSWVSKTDSKAGLLSFLLGALRKIKGKDNAGDAYSTDMLDMPKQCPSFHVAILWTPTPPLPWETSYPYSTQFLQNSHKTTSSRCTMWVTKSDISVTHNRSLLSSLWMFSFLTSAF